MFLHFFNMVNECTAKLCLAQLQQPLGSAPSTLVAHGHAGLAPCTAGAKSFSSRPAASTRTMSTLHCHTSALPLTSCTPLALCAPTAQCVAHLLWLLPAFVAAFEAPFAQYALVDAAGSPANAAATAVDLPLWFVAHPDAVPPFHIHVHMHDSVGAVRQRVAEAYGCVAGLLPDVLFQV